MSKDWPTDYYWRKVARQVDQIFRGEMITRSAFPDLYGEKAIISRRKESLMKHGKDHGKMMSGKMMPPSLKKTAPKGGKKK